MTDLKIGCTVIERSAHGVEGVVTRICTGDSVEEHGFIDVLVMAKGLAKWMKIGDEESYVYFNWEKHLKIGKANPGYEFAVTTPDRNEQLVRAKSPDKYVRCFLALNPALNIDVQRVLIEDERPAGFFMVRRNLARNQALTDDMQLLLAKEFPHEIKNPGPKTKAYLEMMEVLDK